MLMYLPVATFAVALALLILGIWILLRLNRASSERIEPVVRGELRGAREEAASQARALREEVVDQQGKTNTLLVSTLGALANAQRERLEEVASATRMAGTQTQTAIETLVTKTHAGLAEIRTATDTQLEAVRETTEGKLAAGDKAQELRNDAVIRVLTDFTKSNREALDAQKEALRLQLQELQEGNELRFGEMKVTLEDKLRLGLEDQRKHLGDVILALGALEKGNQVEQDKSRTVLDQKLGQIQDSSGKKLDEMRQTVDEKLRLGLEDQRKHLGDVILALGALEKGNQREQEKSRTLLDQKLGQIQDSSGKKLDEMRQTVDEKLRLGLEDQRKHLGEVILALGNLEKGNQVEQEKSRTVLDQKLAQIQESNEKKLEEMRATVDEKLHKTLETRLGESFKLVSDKLEAVQKGLGEMQGLASDVGGLKRALTNVKIRGTWGECQLAAILEQILTPDQYASNVQPKSNGELVEFAIRLPGQGQDPGKPVWLPIDSKFPREDYERLVEASQIADVEGVGIAKQALLAALRKSAKDIHGKYISPPETTDFAIMFLPTEGLYAEALREPGFGDELLRSFRVLIAGPTTLSAILTSLRVGFQTLAIEKRAHEIWDVLRGVKTEFSKFGMVLEKVKKQLATASNSIDETATRTRAIERKLREVETLPAVEAGELLALPELGIGGGEAVEENAASLEPNLESGGAGTQPEFEQLGAVPVSEETES